MSTQDDSLTPVEPITADPTPQSRLEEAEALMLAKEEPEEVTEPEQAPEAEPEAAEAAEPEPKPDDENKPSPERYKESIDSLMAQARRKKKQLTKREAELEARAAELEQKASAAAELDSLWDKSPTELLHFVAQRKGADIATLYEQIGQEQSDPDAYRAQKERGAGFLTEEEFEKRLESKLAERSKDLEKKQQEQTLQNIYHDFAGIQQQDELKKSFPFLASMPAEKFASEISESIAWFAANEPQQLALANRRALATKLEQAAKKEYEEWSSSYAAMQDATGPGLNGEPGAGADSRPNGQKPAAKRKRTVSDADVASSSGTDRELSPAERFAKADELLSEGITLSFD